GSTGDLEEQLLEIGRHPPERRDAETVPDGEREQVGGGRRIAAEGDLDRLRTHDLGRGDDRLAGEPVPAGGDARRIGEELNPDDLADPQSLADVGDPARGEDAAAIDDRDGGAQLLELREDVAADDDRLAQGPE